MSPAPEGIPSELQRVSSRCINIFWKEHFIGLFSNLSPTRLFVHRSSRSEGTGGHRQRLASQQIDSSNMSKNNLVDWLIC